MTNEYISLQAKFPFLSIINDNKKKLPYIGIIQNKTKNFVAIYLYEDLKNIEERKRFLEYGETWWWESNRTLPISIFLKEDFDEFKYSLKNIHVKDFELISGPLTSLSNIAQKRIKRTTVNLLKFKK